MTWSLLLLAYLLGAVPTGWLVVRLVAGRDVREVGSGNIGATNVVRAVGWGWGVATLLFDAAKGALTPVLLGHLAPPQQALVWQLAAGALSLLGNVFNPFLNWRGGKGVGTAIGIGAALAPLPLLAAVVAFALGLLASRIVSVGSLAGGAVFGLASVAVYFRSQPRPPGLWLGFCLAVVVMVFVTHRANIRRLLAGTESRLTRQK
jgi:glycerol-3-phosphate acyltransferase PlsY